VKGTEKSRSAGAEESGAHRYQELAGVVEGEIDPSVPPGMPEFRQGKDHVGDIEEDGPAGEKPGLGAGEIASEKGERRRGSP
jgi:hypothetical protein